jgi:transmembrane sensor
MKPERRYADAFKPQLSEAETSELWQGIATRTSSPLSSPARRSRLFVGVGIAAVVASAAAFLLFQAPQQPLVAGQTMTAPAEAAQVLELPDGSKVELEASARVRIEKFSPEDARLVLLHGAARFDVQHRAARSFVVRAGSVDVAVIGTRFRVGLGLGSADSVTGRVDVEVERGIVEVRRPGSTPPVTLAAGERWTSASGFAATTALVVPSSAPAALPAQPPTEAPPPSSAPPVRAVGSVGAPPSETASSVFEAANQARVAGRSREAANLFDQLRRTYRRDPRAALAALQLGRIRLDDLGDARGAIEALNDALALGGGGSLRDDAQARLVEAYAKSGNVAACRQAKQAYLTGQPHGPHRGAVEQRCP